VILDDNSVIGVLSLQDIAGATIPRQFKANAQMAAAMYRRGFFTEICQQLKNKPIRTIMRRDFVAVNLKDNIMTVMADFMKNDLYIVPVIENKKLLGVVTRTEIKKALWEAMTFHQAQQDE
jgi:predicted transcriptional regulator